MQRYGGIDVLVNNAGIAISSSSGLSFPEQVPVFLISLSIKKYFSFVFFLGEADTGDQLLGQLCRMRHSFPDSETWGEGGQCFQLYG